MTNFEPFDLKRAEAGEPVMFRGTTDKVEFKCALHDADGSVRSLLFVCTSNDGFELELTRHPDGMFAGVDVYSPLDIVMKPKTPVTKTFWACFNLNAEGDFYGGYISTKPEESNWQYCIPFQLTIPPTK